MQRAECVLRGVCEGASVLASPANSALFNVPCCIIFMRELGRLFTPPRRDKSLEHSRPLSSPSSPCSPLCSHLQSHYSFTLFPAFASVPLCSLWIKQRVWAIVCSSPLFPLFPRLLFSLAFLSGFEKLMQLMQQVKHTTQRLTLLTWLFTNFLSSSSLVSHPK